MTAADVWTELAPSVLADRITGEIRDIIVAFENNRDRTKQTAMGPSGIGSPCARCLARNVLGCPVERGYDPHVWRRIVGTAVHAWLAEAALHHNKAIGRGRYVIESRVHPDGKASELLPKGGDADLYDGDTDTVVDYKTKSFNGIKEVKANGPKQQQRYQGHLYGLGFARLGRPVKNVALAFIPREGALRDFYVHVEPYDEAVAVEALERFRTIRTLALANGVAILPHLPADPDCFDCGGADIEETK